MRPNLRRFLVLAVLLTGVLASAAEPRIVAVGDVHGDYDGAVSILREAGLIDAHAHWKGGNAVLVQTGDLLDRGPRPRDVLDLFMNLEAEAPRSGGRVVVVLGNHEVMNLMGDLRYDTPEEFAQFASAKSEKLRQSAYLAYLDWRQRRQKAGVELPPELSREAWMAQHPAGFIEHRQSFASDGKYGRWLRRRPAVFVLGGTAFVHAGFGPKVASGPLEEVNRRIHDEIATFDRDSHILVEEKIIPAFATWEELTAAVGAEIHRRIANSEKSGEATAAALAYLSQSGRWLSMDPEGPLWYRGYDSLSDAEGSELLASFLKSHSLQHVVAGHTPQSKREIRSRFSGGVFQIDTGMLSSFYPGGQPSALEISEGRFTAIYRDRRMVLLPAPAQQSSLAAVLDEEWRFGGGADNVPPPASSFLTHAFVGPDNKPLPFKDDDEIIDFLSTAEVKSMRNTPGEGTTSPKKILLEKNGIQMDAVFRTVDEEKQVAGTGNRVELLFRDSYLFEPAAYWVDRLLGMHFVPPAVLRKIQGQPGSVQLWVENAMTEGERKKRGVRPPDTDRWNHAIHTMRVFDNLIYNTDRNVGNFLIDNNGDIWFIDHTRTFRRQTDLLDPKLMPRVERHLWQSLQTVNEAEMRQKLTPFLRKEEIDSLFKRRQKLVAYVEKMIREKGESNVLYSYPVAAGDSVPVK